MGGKAASMGLREEGRGRRGSLQTRQDTNEAVASCQPLPKSRETCWGAIEGGNQQLSYLEAMTPPTWPENILLLSVRHRPGSKV